MKSELLIMKFGGTSVGSIDAMRRVVDIVQNAHQSWKKLVIVTSAFNKVTNQLLESAAQASQGDTQSFYKVAEELRSRHFEMTEALVTDPALKARVKRETNTLIVEFENLCQAISVLGEANSRALDSVASLGERLSVRVLAGALNAAGLDAVSIDSSQVVVTDEHFQSANPDMAATRQKCQQIINPFLERDQIIATTGFIASTPKGAVTTLGRGGSDFSAAILGVSLNADEVWIYTDVDGVMTADPRLVPQAFTLPVMSYREIAELAYYGAKVLHPKTIRPVIEAGIGLKVLNTFNPNHPGTRIVSDDLGPQKGVIKAITNMRGLKLVNLEGRGMLGVPGVAARTFQAVAATGASVPLITQASSEQSICFAVPVESAERVVKALQDTFAVEINHRDIDGVSITEEVGIISVVGGGMIHTPGIAGRIFTTLGAHGVNVIAIAQGSSEVSISLVVKTEDTQTAVAAIHKLLLDEKEN